MARDAISIAWIAALAEPYLRGYRNVPQHRGSVRGYWFLHPASSSRAIHKRAPADLRGSETALGFFVGYIVGEQDHAFLDPQPPECVAFAFVLPVGGSAHRRLVREQDSLLRRTFAYIRWLTHRPPRFAFYEDELPALVRHRSMHDWPRAKYEHFSRNFFIETLAWLVRSGLARKLLAEAAPRAAATRRLEAKSSTGKGQRCLPRKTA